MINAIWKWADQDGDGFLNRAESDRLQEKIEGAKLTGSPFHHMQIFFLCVAFEIVPLRQVRR